MKFYTIGYGGRSPQEFVVLLARHGIRAVVDVRIRPDRASMGAFILARTSDKGIEKTLAEQGIEYHSRLELGNIFFGLDDWRTPYGELLQHSGALLVRRLQGLPEPFCLLCAEKQAAECHRKMIADHLVVQNGWEVEHIE
jgi:uncharacterized protein (DUF488 family)